MSVMQAMLDNVSLPLFVPADRPDRLVKAANSRPDAVIIDLEDAVSTEKKFSAREALPLALASLTSDVPMIVRINAFGTPWHDGDVALVKDLRLAAIILPKAESAFQIEMTARASGLPVVALIESALGLVNVRDIALKAARLAFGSIDYAADLAIGHSNYSLLHARSEIVLASRLAKLSAPIDGVTTEIEDEETLLSDCAHSVEMGFGGKLLIHPKQIETARRGFQPSVADLSWAIRVLEAAKSGAAAIRVDGNMVDAPVILRAQQLLRRADQRIEL